MKNRRNYYRILHVQPDAPRDIIKASYRALMQKLRMHPDLGGDEWNAAALNEAYAVLSKPEQRQAYDQQFLMRQGMAGPNLRQRDHTTREHGYRTGPSPSPRYRGDSACPFCGTPKHNNRYYSDTNVCSGCAAPLQPVVRLKPTGNYRRLVQRTQHHATLRYFTSARDRKGYRGLVRNLSTLGLCFLSARRLNEGDVIRITADILSATARVTYCYPCQADWRHTVGLEFLTLCLHENCGTFVSVTA